MVPLFLTLLFQKVDAQRYSRKKVDIFQGSITGGFNLSQVDGDGYTGYDKVNPNFGLRASVYLKHNLFLDIGMAYTTKGANFENEALNFRVSRPKDRSIHLSYVEVPFSLRWTPSKQSRLYLESGLSYNRMVSSEIVEKTVELTTIVFEKFETDFRNWEISSIIGAGYSISNRIGIGLRFNYGLSKYFINDNPREENFFTQGLPPEVLFLRNYSLGLQFSYKML